MKIPPLLIFIGSLLGQTLMDRILVQTRAVESIRFLCSLILALPIEFLAANSLDQPVKTQ